VGLARRHRSGEEAGFLERALWLEINCLMPICVMKSAWNTSTQLAENTVVAYVFKHAKLVSRGTACRALYKLMRGRGAMFGMQELKKELRKGVDTVECPFNGCENRVIRMHRGIVRSLDASLENEGINQEEFNQYLCRDHKIYITPSTFIYKYLKDNLLWYDDDKDVLDEIMKVKRVKAQFHHDNSEDAVSWNVFRFLEKTKLLSGFLERLRCSPVGNPEVIYWSYSQSQRGVWDELRNARTGYGEEDQRGSEPDLIIKTDNLLVFIEAKLTSENKIDFNRSHTAGKRRERINRYSRGSEFLKSGVEDIIDAGYYQLMRLWLIGAEVARSREQNFCLVSVVRNGYEGSIEQELGEYIKQDDKRRFFRVTWEDIYKHILSTGRTGEDKVKILDYFKNKTIGYERGNLQAAFSL
jgi:hypothetical protein